MLITPSTTDIEDIIRNLLSWVPNNFKLGIVKNAIDKDIIDSLEREVSEKLYYEVREEVLEHYVYIDAVEDRAEELAKENFAEEIKQYESEIEFWKTKYYDIEGKLHNLLNPKTENVS